LWSPSFATSLPLLLFFMNHVNRALFHVFCRSYKDPLVLFNQPCMSQLSILYWYCCCTRSIHLWMTYHIWRIATHYNDRELPLLLLDCCPVPLCTNS
jgi:hypothetical protein